jgi:hypothetical protein
MLPLLLQGDLSADEIHDINPGPDLFAFVGQAWSLAPP